jgi:hypothetical protein
MGLEPTTFCMASRRSGRRRGEDPALASAVTQSRDQRASVAGYDSDPLGSRRLQAVNELRRTDEELAEPAGADDCHAFAASYEAYFSGGRRRQRCRPGRRLTPRSAYDL